MTRFIDMERELRQKGYARLRNGKGRHVVFASEHGKIVVPHVPGDINEGLVKHIRCTVRRQMQGSTNTSA